MKFIQADGADKKHLKEGTGCGTENNERSQYICLHIAPFLSAVKVVSPSDPLGLSGGHDLRIEYSDGVQSPLGRGQRFVLARWRSLLPYRFSRCL